MFDKTFFYKMPISGQDMHLGGREIVRFTSVYAFNSVCLNLISLHFESVNSCD